jgi:dynactin-4
MSSSVLFHCSHQDTPHAPLPPAYSSSFSAFSPLDTLYFCEECDAIRCDQCVVVEVASYYCPSCLFDVPSHNVRTDKNR